MKYTNIILFFFLFALNVQGQIEFEENIKCCGKLECAELEGLAACINDLIIHPPSTDEQTLTNNDVNGVTESITISNGNTIPINHPDGVMISECVGRFVYNNNRTGWLFPWTQIYNNVGNVATVLGDWEQVSQTYITPACASDVSATANLGNHLIYSRRTRSYYWIDVRLLVNGAPVQTWTYNNYLYLDKRDDTNPDVITPQLYEIYNLGVAQLYRQNVPANAVVTVEARRRYRTVGSQPSNYFRTIGGLRSNVSFVAHNRTNIE